MQEQEDKSKQHKARKLAAEIERMQGGLKNLSIQERSITTLEVIREEVLLWNPLKETQQCEVTLLGEDKNKNGKRNP
jgi:hypothetical protein